MNEKDQDNKQFTDHPACYSCIHFREDRITCQWGVTTISNRYQPDCTHYIKDPKYKPKRAKKILDAQ